MAAIIDRTECFGLETKDLELPLKSIPWDSLEEMPRFSGYSLDHRFERSVWNMLQAVEEHDAWEAFTKIKGCSLLEATSGRHPKVRDVSFSDIVAEDGHSGATMGWCIGLTVKIINEGPEAYQRLSENNQRKMIEEDRMQKKRIADQKKRVAREAFEEYISKRCNDMRPPSYSEVVCELDD